jgi:hypothetical protein
MLAWLAPPGTDLAAHAYQRTVFLQHGFALWNNFWYAGRYSFVTYSVLYYPLAALLGIRLLAVATIATATLAFVVVVRREWGRPARWSGRTFAIVWAGIMLSAAFPFALGVALALLALWALQAGARWRFAGLAVLTLAASPVAFLLLAVLLAGIGLAKRTNIVLPAAAIIAAGVGELLLWRLFPGGGRYPFSLAEYGAAGLFCAIGVVLTWREQPVLRFIFLAYFAACTAVFVVPSAIGENIARLRFAAIPVAVLALSLRNWRPLWAAAGALALATSWNLTPIAASFAKDRVEPGDNPSYWAPAIGFLHAHLTPSYRVEAVDTAGHWAAVYLPRAGIPLARGWYRQDDFPQNEVLYGPLGARAYRAWLRSLGVRYVVLTSGPIDYSARGEKRILESGRSGLVPVFHSPTTEVYELPHPRPILTGAGTVRWMGQQRILLRLRKPGHFLLAVRYSPYWHTRAGCLSATKGGMMRLTADRAGLVQLRFDVDAGGALRALAGGRGTCEPLES